MHKTIVKNADEELYISDEEPRVADGWVKVSANRWEQTGAEQIRETGAHDGGSGA